MVYLSAPEEWQRQSALLLQACPTTTRITTKYNIPNLDSQKYQRLRKRKRGGGSDEKKADIPRVPKAVLVLKTYDPESGVVLKFKTDRAADVGRLINGMRSLGRHMAALPENAEDAVMEDAAPMEPAVELASAAHSQGAPTTADAKPQPAAGGGGGVGKKKKKGKK